MLGLLERRYRGQDRGNGPAWAWVPKVRNAAGFSATNTCDGIAMALWPSRGLELHGHEVKVSRSDWLKELRKPEKAEAFTIFCDRWWIVAGDAEIVHDDELPPGWGLMIPRGQGLGVVVQAEKLSDVAFSGRERHFLAALLRSAARTHQTTPEEVEDAVRKALEAHRSHDRRERERLEQQVLKLRERLTAFARESGVELGLELDDPARERWHGTHPASEVGAAVRLVLNGEANVEQFTRRLQTHLDITERLAADLRRALGKDA